ncbi:alkaline phosphatase D family protein [Rhodococcus sp. NPDC060090]|uniref:alkaline phosphatase D family protein n=1 Tax=Rhodococcus sp. NPDC060090 TaxID=3347056 RepID=UPI0036585788
MPLSRRSFLTADLGISIVTTVTSVSATGCGRARASGLKGDPFMLGVASGDPAPDGFVIWTRLALDPIADDSLGGMPNRSIPVQWEVAEDEQMARVVARGEEQAVLDSAHSVHVELFGLRPGREYFHRFRTGDHMSIVGRALTTPAATETPAALAMAFASCAQYEHTTGEYVSDTGLVRAVDGPQTVTLENYRQRHARTSQTPICRQPMRSRRGSSAPTGHDMKIFRRIQWGNLANFHMLDTRQYRDDQAAGDGWQENMAERHDEARTLTGAEQEAWLLDGFRTSTAHWDFLGQQLFFAEQDKDPSPTTDEVSMDSWDGYAASRRRITEGWVDSPVRNAVVLTGDVHRHWANDIKVDFADPDAPKASFEIVSGQPGLQEKA